MPSHVNVPYGTLDSLLYIRIHIRILFRYISLFTEDEVNGRKMDGNLYKTGKMYIKNQRVKAFFYYAKKKLCKYRYACAVKSSWSYSKILRFEFLMKMALDKAHTYRHHI